MKWAVFLCFVSCVFAGDGFVKVGLAKDGLAKGESAKVGYAKTGFAKGEPAKRPERGIDLLSEKGLEVFFNTRAIKVHNKDKMGLGKKCTSRCWESALSRHAPHPKEKQLLVFVSFSLGKEILRTLFDEVDKRGGRLILRGLKENSFVKTQYAIQALGINVDIDPPLFKKFKIMCVPTFVVCVGDKADRVAGTMSLRAALEMLQEEGDVYI